jgi:DNA-binding NtrC family response regulator
MRIVALLESTTCRRVLMVDDETAATDAAREYLLAFGLEADTAAEREEAEALLAKREYGLLIADLRLTGIHGREGLELVRYVREQQPLCRIIVLTGHGSVALEREARRIGADAFLEKPLPLAELRSAAERLLAEPTTGAGVG